MASSRSKNQDAFWMAMLDKYEQRNRELEEQQCNLQHHLEAMECAMPAALMSRMNKKGDTQNINMAEFMSQVGKPVTDTHCPCIPSTSTSRDLPGVCEAGQPIKSVSSNCFCGPYTARMPPAKDAGPRQSKASCGCEPCADSSQNISAESSCECNPCLADDRMLDKLSVFSLQSSDLLFMAKLQEMVAKENQMKRQIQEMEHREQAYMDTLRQADEMWANMEGNYRKRLSDVQQNGDCMRMKYQQLNEQLMDENSKLVDELKDAKLELRQCMERLEGPVCRQLDQERCKCKKLETELMLNTQKMANKECSFMKNLGDMQNQLNCTCGKLCELTSANEQLKQQMCCLQCKYNELQQDLINQKISEAHTLQRLNETLALNEQIQRSAEPDDNTLHGIARKLSKTLATINQCQECAKVPADLKDTCHGIKDIADIVSSQPGRQEKTAAAGSGRIDINIQSGMGIGAEITVTRVPSGKSSIKASRETCGKLSQRSSKSICSCGDPCAKPSYETRRTPSRTQSENISGGVTGKLSTCSEKCPSHMEPEKRDTKVSIQEPSDVYQLAIPEQQSYGAKSQEQEVEILTEIHRAGDVELEIETEVNLYETVSDGINITTTITGSGVLEVITEGPAGVIETTMSYTDSGNLEVVTQLVEYPSKLDTAPSIPAIKDSGKTPSELKTEAAVPTVESISAGEKEQIKGVLEEPGTIGEDETSAATGVTKTGAKTEETEGVAAAEGGVMVEEAKIGAEEADVEPAKVGAKGEADVGTEAEASKVVEGASEAGEATAATERVEEISKAGITEETGVAEVVSETKKAGETGVVSELEGTEGSEAAGGAAVGETSPSVVAEGDKAGVSGELDEISTAEKTQLTKDDTTAEEPVSTAAGEEVSTSDIKKAAEEADTSIDVEVATETTTRDQVETGTEEMEKENLGKTTEEKEQEEQSKCKAPCAGEVTEETPVSDTKKTEEIETETEIAGVDVATGDVSEDESTKTQTPVSDIKQTEETETETEIAAVDVATGDVSEDESTKTQTPVSDIKQTEETETKTADIDVATDDGLEEKSTKTAGTQCKGPCAGDLTKDTMTEPTATPEQVASALYSEEAEKSIELIEIKDRATDTDKGESEEPIPSESEVLLVTIEAEETGTKAAFESEMITDAEDGIDVASAKLIGECADIEDLRKGVAEALNKANKEVMDALEKANKDVTTALEKANRDVENALAEALKGAPTLSPDEEHPKTLSFKQLSPTDIAILEDSSETSKPSTDYAGTELLSTSLDSKPSSDFTTPAPSEPTSGFTTPAPSEPASGFTTPAPSEPPSGFATPAVSEKPSEAVCKDVCSPTYAEQKKETCLDICAEDAKKRREAAVEVDKEEITSPVQTTAIGESSTQASAAVPSSIQTTASAETASQKTAVEVGTEPAPQSGAIEVDGELCRAALAYVQTLSPETVSSMIKISADVESEAVCPASMVDTSTSAVMPKGVTETLTGEMRPEEKPGLKETLSQATVASSAIPTVSSENTTTSSRIPGTPSELTETSTEMSTIAPETATEIPASTSKPTTVSEDVRTIPFETSAAEAGASSVPSETIEPPSETTTVSSEFPAVPSGVPATTVSEGVRTIPFATSAAEAGAPSVPSETVAPPSETTTVSSEFPAVPAAKAEEVAEAGLEEAVAPKAADVTVGVPEIPSAVSAAGEPSLPETLSATGREILSEGAPSISAEQPAAGDIVTQPADTEGRDSTPPTFDQIGSFRRASVSSSAGSLRTMPTEESSFEKPKSQPTPGAERRESGERRSRIPVPVKRDSKTGEIICDCKRCDCRICTPDVMKTKKEQKPKGCTCTLGCKCVVCSQLADSGSLKDIRGGDAEKSSTDKSPSASKTPSKEFKGFPGPESTKDRADHPPDCDCLDCICDPCRIFSEDPRKHPPECDCISCLCDPCGLVSQEICDSEETCPGFTTAKPDETRPLPDCYREIGVDEICPGLEEKRSLHKIVERISQETPHLEGCDCLLCRCCGCAKPADVDEKRTDFVPKPADEASKPQHKFPPEDCNCEECACPDGKPPPPNLIDKMVAHPSNCSCLDCSLLRDVSTNKEVKEEQKKHEEHPEDCDCVECLCEFGPLKAKKQLEGITKVEEKHEIEELQEVIKKIQCACYEAEIQAQRGVTDPAILAQQKESYQETMSGLHLALESIQAKCKQKDRMIAAMIKELENRSDSKIFNDLLQKLAKASSTEIDFDRTEICNSLPRPLCDTKYGKQSNQLATPLPCKPCEHPNYPNCPCSDKIAQFPKQETKPSEALVVGQNKPLDNLGKNSTAVCSHPNYPNCPCSPTCGTIEQKPNIIVADDKPPSDVPPESTPEKKSGKKCDHPNFPNCPCIQPKPEETSKSPCPDPEGACTCSSKRKSSKACICPKHSRNPRKSKELLKAKSSQLICRPCGKERKARRENKAVSSVPMEITDVRRISPDSLIIKWTAPESKCVTGYEILVDGIIKSRVLSASRTSAVLHSLQFKDALNISVYAIAKAGRCEPPAKAIFQV